MADALETGQHVVLRIPRVRPSCWRKSCRELLRPAREMCAALVLSGGDSASLVYRALGMHGIQLGGEITAGIPHGRVGVGNLIIAGWLQSQAGSVCLVR